MKVTENKRTLELVSRLSELVENRLKMAKEEKEIKDELRAVLDNLGTRILGAGDYVMVVTDRTRNDMDKEKVKALLGDQFATVFKQVDYQTFEVKKA